MAFDLTTASAVATANAVRNRRVSALEACDAAIARIEKLDGPINAVVVRDFERARAAAKKIDSVKSTDERRPLIGVPMTVKESNDVAGLPSTWGMPVFKDLPVHEDGVVAARLKAAGAVILGKTNAPVALADWQAVNPIYGRTVNPYDHTRSPGGSSGGSAAALATSMVPLEAGSDIGGSIRIPAHMCGVYGHKPTYGIIPLKGHGFPGTDAVDVPLAVVGPMARSAEDLLVALDVLAGPLPGVGYRLDLPPTRHRALKDFRVAVIDAHAGCATSEEVRAAVNSFADGVAEAGGKVVRLNDVPDLSSAHTSYVAMLMSVTTRGAPGATPMDAHAWMELQDAQMRLARRWREIFADVDVIVTPTFGVPAFEHQDDPNWGARTLTVDGETTPYGQQLFWPGVATYPGLPATAVPVTKSKGGLPIGVQVMGDLYDDRTTLTFAALAQQAGIAT